MKKLLVILAVSFLASCGLLPTTPEQQIRDGANTVTVGATLAGSLLTVDKITKAQAVSYRNILGTAGKHLDTAFATLSDCRKKTGSTEKKNPDPCKPGVQADINLGVSIAGDVKKVLDSK